MVIDSAVPYGVQCFFVKKLYNLDFYHSMALTRHYAV